MEAPLIFHRQEGEMLHKFPGEEAHPVLGRLPFAS